MRRMDALRKSDKAIVFVTHSLYQVEALCDSALWLEHGRVRQYGPANEVVRSYLDDQERRAMRDSAEEGVVYEGRGTAATRAFFDARDAAGSQTASAPQTDEAMTIESVEVLAADGEPCEELPFLSSAPSGSGITAHVACINPCSICASFMAAGTFSRPACSSMDLARPTRRGPALLSATSPCCL